MMTDRELLKGTIDDLSFIANAYDDDLTVAQCACSAYEMANTARARLVILKKHLAVALIEQYAKRVPRAMLEETYSDGFEAAFGTMKMIDHDTRAAKYGYKVEE